MNKTKIKIFAKLIRYYLRIVYACDIMPTVIIGEGTKFAHSGLGVVIHPNARIGMNCKISQNVTIGGRSGYDAAPKIGDNVLIGANALILGPITIGNNVQIGGGSVVIKSVPDNAVVVGNPGKIIKYINEI